MTNIEIIKAACVKANPEIMELKFGCGLKITHEHFANSKSYPLSKYGEFEYKVLTVTTDPNVFLILAKFGIEHFNWKEIDRFCEILGRPITLADVLLAIDRARVDVRALIQSPDTLSFEKVTFGDTLIGDWNLRASLEDQSEETLKFLADLLH